MWREFDLIFLFLVGFCYFYRRLLFLFPFVSVILSAICYFNILFARVFLSLYFGIWIFTPRDMFVNISEPVVVGYKRFEHSFYHPAPSITWTLCTVLYIQSIWHSRLLLLITASHSFVLSLFFVCAFLFGQEFSVIASARTHLPDGI